jgi:DNA-binding response OmpR family regulator
MKILVVEDEELIRRDIAEELESENFEVIQACDGDEGLSTIIADKPDLVLSDITMPKMNGHEMLLALRENHPDLADIPFVFLSALADRQDILHGKVLGADDYLTKPIDFEMMIATVNARLRQVKRMEERKQAQFVKLYDALSKPENEEQLLLVDEPAPEPIIDAHRLMAVAVTNGEVDVSEIRSTLESQGHLVIEMESGVVFRSSLDNISPDLVLVSLNTSDMKAPTMVQMMKAERDCHFPVILLVPPSAGETLSPTHETWFDAVVQMPCSATEFAEQIKSLGAPSKIPVKIAS